MNILFALPGLHRVERGAEIAFLSLAAELASGGDRVTLIGSGPAAGERPYRYLRAPSVSRERFERYPRVPLLRGETAYEEASFLPGLLARYRPSEYDVTLTCSYPFTNWALRRPARGHRPPHIFVTQNGDWPARDDRAEFRLFGCEGLICTNPDYFDDNRHRWRSALIPNGIAMRKFGLGSADRARFGIPPDVPVVLMVSALIASKRVADGVRAVSAIDGVHLVCAGDGPLRDQIDALARDLMPGRFSRVVVPARDMPALYRSADVFLHLSKSESFGNVYLEALGCGLPVVAHDVRRVRWIVNDCGYLVDTDDVAALRNALRAALTPQPGRVADRVARAGEFDWSVIAARYRSFAGEVIEAVSTSAKQDRRSPTASKEI